MKIFRSLLLFAALATVFVACEKESLDATDGDLNKSLTVQEASQDEGVLGAKTGPGADTPDPFQTTLQWTSFTAMRAVFDDALAREEFLAALDDSGVVKLDELIGSGSTTPNFSAKFYDFIYNEIYAWLNPGWPGDEGDKPTVPITQDPPPPPANGYPDPAAEVVAYVNQFYDEVLIYNCVELYVPSATNFNEEFEMTSTAHPLDNSDSNTGIRRGYITVVEPKGGGTATFLWNTEDTVDDNYVSNNYNVIVARS